MPRLLAFDRPVYWQAAYNGDDMPRGSDERPTDQTPDGLRRKAGHARRLAGGSADDKASRALVKFAEELEAKATALEQQPHNALE